MSDDGLNHPEDSSGLRARPLSRLLSLPALAVGAALKHPFFTLIGSGGVIAIVMGVVLLSMWKANRSRKISHDLAAELLATLDKEDYAEAKQLAINMHANENATYEDLGVGAYVLGAVSAHEATATLEAPKRKSLHLLATRYLSEARLRGFPEGREYEGLTLLGTSFYEIGRFSASRPPLLAASKRNPKQSDKIHRMLTDAYFFDRRPQYDLALDHMKQYLESPNLTEKERHEGIVHLARMYLAKDDVEASRKAIEEIPEIAPTRSRAMLISARIAILEGDQLVDAKSPENAAAHFETAKEWLEKSEQRETFTKIDKAEADYLLGLYYQRIGDHQQALDQFHETRRQNFMDSISVAAGLSEAQILRAQGKYDDALDVYVRLLNEIGGAGTYSNRWVTLDQLRDHTRQGYLDFLDTNQFQSAVDLAQALGGIFSQSESYRWQAQARGRWAQALEEQANTAAADEQETLHSQSRHQSRVAARLFEHLADLNTSSSDYVEELWRSADHYMRGHKFRDAVRMLHLFLNNVSRDQMPRAQINLGRAYLALGKPKQAIKPLRACIQLNADSAEVYHARLLASVVYQELNDNENAKKLLLANIEYDPNTDPLRPESIEWRDSLLELGKAHYREGLVKEAESRSQEGYRQPTSKEGLAALEAGHNNFQEATLRLEEFTERHERSEMKWAEPFQYAEARYLLAESHRHAAKFPRRKLSVVSIGTTRASLTRQIQAELKLAKEAYETLESDLWKKKGGEGDLTVIEAAMLRNSVFGWGDVLFDLEQYEEAISVYTTAANRYQKRPESLEAYLQIANCYRRLGQPSRAPAFINRARSVLEQQIPQDADFMKTTRYDRDQWVELLDWLTRLYQSEGLGA